MTNEQRQDAEYTSNSTPPRPLQIYHQRQSLLLCAVHAINNVLQHDALTKKDLNAISEQLSPKSLPLFNPHRMCVLGNFDVNVLIVALQKTGHDVVWFDKRTSLTEQGLNWSRIVGCILNSRKGRPHQTSIPGLLGGRHWVALRGFPVAGDRHEYYDLDSKLLKPSRVAGSHAEFARYIGDRVSQTPDAQLLFVVSKEVLDDGTWRPQPERVKVVDALDDDEKL